MKIIHEREKCIGCGTCAAVCPAFWSMGDDGKSHLKDAKAVDGGSFELEVTEAGCNKEAASACPVQIIKVVE